MLLALLVFFAMATQDVAAAMKIRWLGSKMHHPWRAGLAEAVNDVGASLSVGLAGATVVKYGVSVQTFELEAALALAAIIGTRFGDWLTERKGMG